MAQARCARQGTKPHTGIVNFQTFKRIIKRWPFWVMTPTYLRVPTQSSSAPAHHVHRFYAWCVQAYTVSLSCITHYLILNPPRSLPHTFCK